MYQKKIMDLLRDPKHQCTRDKGEPPVTALSGTLP